MTPSSVLLAAAAIGAGTVAAVAGFGIGSVLTPLVAMQVGTKLAVAAVALPHFAATSLRLWTLRKSLDRHVLATFGLASAMGSLAGALLHAVIASRFLTIVLAVLLIITGVMGVFRMTIRFNRHGGFVAGVVSGLLGGLVGSQGPVRAGAMLGLGLSKEAFVATAMAIAFVVDLTRLPVYLLTEGRALLRIWPLIAIVAAGTLGGTLLGKVLLGWLPEDLFRRVVAGLLVVLGIVLLTA